MRSPPGPLSFKSPPPLNHLTGKRTEDQEETGEDWVNGTTKEYSIYFKVQDNRDPVLHAWPPANCAGRKAGYRVRKQHSSKSKTSAPRKGHLAFHRNLIIIHFTAITFMEFTSVEEERGVEGRRCLFLENKGKFWAGVSTCS